MTDLIIPNDLTVAIFFEKDEGGKLKVETAVEQVRLKTEAFIAEVKGDIKHKKTQDAIRSFAAKIASSKTAIDKLRKEANADLNKQVKETNAIGNKAIADLQELQDTARQPLTDFENEEKARVQDHNNALERIKATAEKYLVNWQTTSILEMEEAMITVRNMDDGTWEEFNDTAVKVIDSAVETIGGLIDKRKVYDKDQADLAELRAKQAEADKKAYEEKLKAEGAEAERKRIEQEKLVASTPVVETPKIDYASRIIPKSLSVNEASVVCENMQKYGGSFVQALGVALSKADDFNATRIKNAFPDYWAQYLNFTKRG
tara:strand:- start:56 stop:1006 length:951 start_codon:yes stop_codon:yes gene_type:complete